MPTYTYKCSDPECKHITERMVPISQYKPKVRCDGKDCKAMANRQFRPTGIATDSTFMSGVGTLLDQCGGNEKECKLLVDSARAQGYEPSMNDYYLPTIAEGTGEPCAFISQAGGKAQVRKVLEEKNMSAHGAVTRKRVEMPPKPKKPLADKIVKRLIKEEVRRNPGLKAKSKQEMRERMIDKHAHVS